MGRNMGSAPPALPQIWRAVKPRELQIVLAYEPVPGYLAELIWARPLRLHC